MRKDKSTRFAKQKLKADESAHLRSPSKINRETLKFSISSAEKRALDCVAQNFDREIVESRDGFSSCLEKKYIQLNGEKYELTPLGRQARSSKIL